MGKVLSINVGAQRGIEKRPVNEVKLLEGWGVEGDAHGGDWDRQVSIFPIEALEKVPPEKIDDVLKGSFTENFTVSGILPEQMQVGSLIKIGTAVVKILHVGKDEYKEDGRPYIVSREGRFGRVIKSGFARVGDQAEIIAEE